MTATSPSAPDPGAPRPKAPMPPLDARAPRPPVVRLRKGVVAGAVMAASGLLAGALAWAFVVQPELRARAHDARLEHRAAEPRGSVRPSEAITAGPATYADLGRLPEPRTRGGHRGAADASAPAGPVSRAAPSRARRGPQGVTGEAMTSQIFFAGGHATGGEAGPASSSRLAGDADDRAVYNPHALRPPLSPFEIKAGAVVPAALLTAVDTARAGPVAATVTENVYDTVSGRHLLAPQGARLVGRHEGESRHGDQRAFIVWERLILPNGKSLILTQEPGVDAQGAVGVTGDVDRRLGSLAVATLFAGAITTLGQAARDRDDRSGGWLGDAGDAAAIEAAQVGGKLIDRELQVRPSIRLRPGARVRVFITRDLILEPYRP